VPGLLNIERMEAAEDGVGCVRLYLREAGRVPMLTRQREVEVARRIERGQLRALRVLSHSPVVVRELARLLEDLASGEDLDSGNCDP
jgi:hypothetical protein